MFTCSAVRSTESFLSSAMSATNAGDPRAGGGAGRKAAPDGMTQVRHEPAFGSNGVRTNREGVGRQSAGLGGTGPPSATGASAWTRLSANTGAARMYAYLASQVATSASYIATFRRANARAERAGVARRVSGSRTQ